MSQAGTQLGGAGACMARRLTHMSTNSVIIDRLAKLCRSAYHACVPLFSRDDESFVLLIERILSFAMPCARCKVFVQEPWWRLEWTPTASGWRFYCPCCKESLSGERCLTSRPVFFFEDDVNWNVYVSHDGNRWWCNTEESVYFWEYSASWLRGLDICVHCPSVVGGAIQMA